MARPPRKYALYKRIHGTRRWKREHPDIQGSKDSIIHLYQTLLLGGRSGYELRIRPTPRKKVS